MTVAIASLLCRRRVQTHLQSHHQAQFFLLLSRSSSTHQLEASAAAAGAAATNASTGEFSSSATAASKSSSPTSSFSTTSSQSLPDRRPILPVRHSRHRLPLICTDPVQLKDLTRQVLESKKPLFVYQDKKESREDAWREADVVVQKVEFLLRGHAHTLSGTQWNRWLPPKRDTTSSSTSMDHDDDASQEVLATMQSLVDRLWEEGHAYMSVRASRMEELYGPKEAAETENASSQTENERITTGTKTESSQSLLKAGTVKEDDEDNNNTMYTGEGGMEDLFGDDKDLGNAFAKFTSEPELPSKAESAGLDEDKEASYLNDFALPGPTTHMYDIILDSMACHPACEPEQGIFLLQDILGRHALDGGDEQNSNGHTRPTVLSYNAPIRFAANLPYDGSSSSARLRDEALQLALGAFDALSHSTTLRNSATYTYLLQVIAKYIPTSRTRGNIARGMLHHARLQGLIDENVLAAYKAAHTPSNGEEFDVWNSQYLAERSAKELPHTWRRYSRVRRFHPREATY